MAVDADTSDRELMAMCRPESQSPPEQTPPAIGRRLAIASALRWTDMNWALVLFSAVAVVVATMVAVLGSQVHRNHQLQLRHDLYLSVARQGAVNLTTINYVKAEDDVRRIVDSATGQFHDEFLQRSEPFIAVMKQAQATTEGTVTEAGVESEATDQAQVLVAVSVKTSNSGVVEDRPRLWRMRIGVVKTAEGAKVSNVEFVP